MFIAVNICKAPLDAGENPSTQGQEKPKDEEEDEGRREGQEKKL